MPAGVYCSIALQYLISVTGVRSPLLTFRLFLDNFDINTVANQEVDALQSVKYGPERCTAGSYCHYRWNDGVWRQAFHHDAACVVQEGVPVIGPRLRSSLK